MLVPSRGRPDNIVALLESWQVTSGGAAELLVAVDDDDPELDRYRALDVSLEVGPRLRLGPTLNKLAVERARDHFAIGFLGDDHRLRTKGWDQFIVKELHDLGTGIVYGDDLLQRERLPTAVAMTSDIITTLGYMVPPGLIHMYADNAWLVLGKELGRIRYLPDVVIEHMHPIAGKAPVDVGYAEVNSPGMYARDGAVFQRWLRERMSTDVARLKEILQ